jgi:GNAT superfamily N-acetyltransferase
MIHIVFIDAANLNPDVKQQINTLGKRVFPMDKEFTEEWSVETDMDSSKVVYAKHTQEDRRQVVVACCNLVEHEKQYGLSNIVEIGNLMVHDKWQKKSVGSKMVDTCVDELGTRKTIVAEATDAKASRFWGGLADFEVFTPHKGKCDGGVFYRRRMRK